MKSLAQIFQGGLLGYAAFFSTLVFAKFLASLIGTFNFRIEAGDLEICVIGFVLAGLIQFLEMLKNKNELTESKQN